MTLLLLSPFAAAWGCSGRTTAPGLRYSCPGAGGMPRKQCKRSCSPNIEDPTSLLCLIKHHSKDPTIMLCLIESRYGKAATMIFRCYLKDFYPQPTQTGGSNVC